MCVQTDDPKRVKDPKAFLSVSFFKNSSVPIINRKTDNRLFIYQSIISTLSRSSFDDKVSAELTTQIKELPEFLSEEGFHLSNLKQGLISNLRVSLRTP